MNVGKLKTALILRDEIELNLFKIVMDRLGFAPPDMFHDSAEALSWALKKQYDFFVVRHEMPEVSGLTFLQNIRGTGNSGVEPILLVIDTIDPAQSNIIYDYEIEYVLVKPITPQRILEKILYVVDKESCLTPLEKKYREAKAALYSGVLDMAHQYAVELVEENSNMDKFYVLLGDVELRRGQISAARRSYENGLACGGDSIMPKMGLMHTFVAERNYEKVAKITSELAVQNPLNIQLLIDAGLSHQNAGDLAGAKRYVNEALALDPKNRKVRELLASSAIDEGLYDRSYDILLESHNINEMLFYYINKGVELCRANKYPLAIEVYRMCLARFPDNEFKDVLFYNLALALLRSDNESEAAICLTRCLIANPCNEKALALKVRTLNPAR